MTEPTSLTWQRLNFIGWAGRNKYPIAYITSEYVNVRPDLATKEHRDMIHIRHAIPEPALNCSICKRPLGTSPDTVDCGGDCLRCMAQAGDPDCIKEMFEINVKEMEDAIKHVRAIIVEGALTGFNPLEGDWAERLFLSQGVTVKALENAKWRNNQ